MVEVVLGWTGDAFVPLKRSEKLCNEQFVVGERYIADIGSQTSAAKRGFFFATLKEIYSSLPDDIADRWISFEHFRKTLTIECGYATQMDFTAASKVEAVRIAAFVRSLEPYAIVSVKDAVVTKWTARSTSAREMDGRTFNALVDAVLAKAADMIGVDRKALDDMNRMRRERPDKQIAESNATGSSGDGPELLTGTPGRGLGAGCAPREATNSEPAAQGSGVAEPEHAAKPEGSARPDPSGQLETMGFLELTVDQAVLMLPDGDTVHNQGFGPASIGSDWTKTRAIGKLRHAKRILLLAEGRRALIDHPIGLMEDNGRNSFLQADLMRVAAFLRGTPPAPEAEGRPGKSDPPSGDPGRRRLTYDEAAAMIPMAMKIGAAVIRPDGGLSKSEWTLDEVLYDLKNAAVIALSDKAPGFPVGMQDRNGRVVYFETRPRADG